MGTEPMSSESPKVSGEQGVTMVRAAGSGLTLHCPAQGFPVPSFRSVMAAIVQWDVFGCAGR